MSNTTGSTTEESGSPAMTQVFGGTHGGNGGSRELLGEFASSGLSVGWNRATLSESARDALRAILEQNGGLMDRTFELHHGALVLLRCRMLAQGTRSQLSFDGSQRRRPAPRLGRFST